MAVDRVDQMKSPETVGGADAQAALRARYIDLLERTLKNSIYGESAIETRLRAIMQRIRHPYLTRKGVSRWPAKAHSMMPSGRLHSLRERVEAVLKENIPGDLIETGVWRGGACILMRGILASYGDSGRKVFVADSFEGLPRPDPKYRADRRDRLYSFAELAVSEAEVRENFAKYDLLDDRVVFVKGFFKDTLHGIDSDRFALIRLDGDMYESTMDALTALYDKLSPGGFAIIDDYGGLSACRKAVHDFLDARALKPEINRVDASCVWWRKS